MSRTALIADVAARIVALDRPHPLRVAVDGVDGAGKTCFGAELAVALTASGRSVIESSVDGFHHPRSVRYARGKTSPDGYYADSYDYRLLGEALLDPLGPGGSRTYRRQGFDYRTDRAVAAPVELAPDDAVLVLDGLFLHRPELRDRWDYSAFLRVAFDTSVPRMAGRDGSSPDPAAESNRRYVEGQRIYLREASPERHATLVIDNNDIERPFIVNRWVGSGT